jgi:hypothetical protein
MGKPVSDIGKQLMDFMEELTFEVVNRGGIHEISNEELERMFEEIGEKHNGENTANT